MLNTGPAGWDDTIEDYTRAGVDRQVRELRGYERRFQAVDPKPLSERVRGDRELPLSSIRGTLLE